MDEGLMLVGRKRTYRLQVYVNRDWLTLIDGWRRSQPEIPTQSGAVRRLIDKGLTKDAAIDPENGKGAPNEARDALPCSQP